MSAPNPAHLKAQFQALSLSRHVGRVMGVQGGVIRIQGLANAARIGDRLELKRNTGSSLHGEVLQVDADAINMLPDAAPDGVALGNRVILQKMPEFAPSASWIGRVVDPFGRPLDGRPLLRGEGKRNLMASPPPAVERKPLGARISTGMSVLNTVLPIVQGQRIGLFAGSGVGET